MMKRLIRWALNRIPRPMLQRMAGWAVPLAGLLYKGRGAECPVCGARYHWKSNQSANLRASL